VNRGGALALAIYRWYFILLVCYTIGVAKAPSVRRRGRPGRAEQVAARRRSLLDAAHAVFRRDGYTGATVDSIAEEAGLTKGAVYSHFDSKADLFLCLLEERVESRASDHDIAATQVRDNASMLEFLKRATAPSLRDREWGLALVEFRVVAARDRALNARYRQIHDAAVAGLVDVLSAIYDSAGVDPPQPLEVLARTALAIEAGGLLETVIAEATPDDDVVGRDVVALMTRVLGLPVRQEEQ
jgi:AcrR family transcriptional regulator